MKTYEEPNESSAEESEQTEEDISAISNLIQHLRGNLTDNCTTAIESVSGQKNNKRSHQGKTH